jgi:hypothetical protein
MRILLFLILVNIWKILKYKFLVKVNIKCIIQSVSSPQILVLKGTKL